jgi:hypothetical protein
MAKPGWKRHKQDWREFVTEQPNGCLYWNGKPNNYGYGQVRWNKRHGLAHRIVFWLVNGEIPEGAMVLHRCDNRMCVNPEHLYLGDNAQNVADMMERGRSCKGRERPRRLSPDDVRSIRQSPKPGVELAREYGVSEQHISMIKVGRRWGNLKCA